MKAFMFVSFISVPTPFNRFQRIFARPYVINVKVNNKYIGLKDLFSLNFKVTNVYQMANIKYVKSCIYFYEGLLSLNKAVNISLLRKSYGHYNYLVILS